ncbi:hypothetical protein Tco_0972521 [Tanacetum coccineum]
MAHLVENITFASTRSGVMEIAFLAQREISVIVGVAVVVVAVGAIVESSSVVKLSFVVTKYDLSLEHA